VLCSAAEARERRSAPARGAITGFPPESRAYGGLRAEHKGSREQPGFDPSNPIADRAN
jgi:hypothetical protein